MNRLNTWSSSRLAEEIGVTNSKGCNIIILSFWWPNHDGTSHPYDTAKLWSRADEYFRGRGFGTTKREIQANLKRSYHQQGTKVMVSAFGAGIRPTTETYNPIAVGRSLAMFVIENQLDGVDVDYEDNAAMEKGTAIPWLITMTKAMLQIFNAYGRGKKFYISHAPQAPYFYTDTPKYKQTYSDFYHTRLDNGRGKIGDYIDFFNVQFYNQGTSDYLTYETLFLNSKRWATGTALLQIARKGIPMNKIVVGKPVTTGDAYNSGFVDQYTLANIFRTARRGPWAHCSNVGGVMNWQFISDTTNWMRYIRAAINC